MEIRAILESIKSGSGILANIDSNTINECLRVLAKNLIKETDNLLANNKKDLDKIAVEDPLYDRLLLTEERVKALALSLEKIADLDSPIGDLIEEKELPNKLILKRITVPLGVVAAIFEARPNVVVDIFALCFKTQNACVLKGGSDAAHSNECMVKIIKNVLKEYGLESVVELLPNDREILKDVLKANSYIDVIIPRGSKALIDFVRENATVPVIETGAGVVHIYVDEFCDLEKCQRIIFNAKTSRPAVCNALDTLLVHKSQVKNLPLICGPMADKKVQILADENAFAALQASYPAELLEHAQESDFGREFLGLSLAIKTVNNLQKAIEHINKFGSRHSEAIITEDFEKSTEFMRKVDAACVYHNASTRFTDGGEFGFGAEVGISTQKLHVRGPMGLKALTTYKWLIYGNGQVRA